MTNVRVVIPAKAGIPFLRRVANVKLDPGLRRGDRPTRPRTKPAYTSPIRSATRLIIGKLTTHVLDTAHGCPAAGMKVTLLRIDGADREIASVTLNDDGRAPGPMLESLEVGRYRIVFAVADYFRARGTTLPDPPFLDFVPIEFGIADVAANYHVPLLVSPWSYATYRGS